MKPTCRRGAPIALALLAACGGAVPDEELTLDSCTTDVDPAAPAFYARYFRCVTVTVAGTDVTITSDGLPPHRSPYYGEGHPNYEAFDTSRGAAYFQNPNRIAEQRLSVTIPSDPQPRGVAIDEGTVDGRVNTHPAEYQLGTAGIALDGVALFNPLAAPGHDIEHEKFTFDAYAAHPEPRGTYHYHTATPGPLEVLEKAGVVTKTAPGEAEIEVYGILCDGTVVLGCTELDGSAPGGTLDAQGGHEHDLVDELGATHFAGRYHTHVCANGPGYRFTPEIRYYAGCE